MLPHQIVQSGTEIENVASFANVVKRDLGRLAIYASLPEHSNV